MENQIKGKSILVTGANGGMGVETVRILAQMGARRIALACRTIEKAKEAIQEIGTTDTVLEPFGGFDMVDDKILANAVSKLPKEKFDIVFLQSGGLIVGDSYQFVEANGLRIEKTIQQNAIGGLLTFFHLENADLIKENARIVFAGGEGVRGIPKMIKKPDFQTKTELMDYVTSASGKYNAIDAIGVSKYASALYVQKLAELDNSKTYLWFSPGLTGGTKGLNTLPNPKRFVMKYIGFPIMQAFGIAQGPQKAAGKYVAALNGEHGISGDLIGAPEGKTIGKLVDQKPMNPALTNHQLIDALWDYTKSAYPILEFKSQLVTE